MTPEFQPTPVPEECRRELQLWAAVLSKAIRDWRSGTSSVKAESARWMYSDDYGIGSFKWVCDLFNVTPEFALERIVNPEISCK